MCNVSSDILIRSEPQIFTHFHQNNTLNYKRYTVNLDYSVYDKLGFEIINIKRKSYDGTLLNEYLIDKIVVDSPASHAMLQNEDRIIQINGYDIDKLDLTQVKFLIKESKLSNKKQLILLIGLFILKIILKKQKLIIQLSFFFCFKNNDFDK